MHSRMKCNLKWFCMIWMNFSWRNRNLRKDSHEDWSFFFVFFFLNTFGERNCTSIVWFRNDYACIYPVDTIIFLYLIIVARIKCTSLSCWREDLKYIYTFGSLLFVFCIIIKYINLKINRKHQDNYSSKFWCIIPIWKLQEIVGLVLYMHK